ncbi:Phenylalanine--tRNA ligase beta subunit [Trichinella spiralis]|uniref:Phenylalanine--tRNA ligase beta subunit n=1 Tax=Trichinella spiralis TaxID=6334 RepID=A0ABR3K137_TRISP
MDKRCGVQIKAALSASGESNLSSENALGKWTDGQTDGQSGVQPKRAPSSRIFSDLSVHIIRQLCLTDVSVDRLRMTKRWQARHYLFDVVDTRSKTAPALSGIWIILAC